MPVGLDVALVAQVPLADGHSCALPGVHPAASGFVPLGPPPGNTTLGEPGVGTPMTTTPVPAVPMPPFGIMPMGPPPPAMPPGFGMLPPAPVAPGPGPPPGIALPPPPQPTGMRTAVRRKGTREEGSCRMGNLRVCG